MIGNRLNSHGNAPSWRDRYKDEFRLENEKIFDLRGKRMRIFKNTLFNHTKETCIFCQNAVDKDDAEFNEDWLSYLCLDCKNEYAKKWNIEFEKL